jgi:hypothetical protein
VLQSVYSLKGSRKNTKKRTSGGPGGQHREREKTTVSLVLAVVDLARGVNLVKFADVKLAPFSLACAALEIPE